LVCSSSFLLQIEQKEGELIGSHRNLVYLG